MKSFLLYPFFLLFVCVASCKSNNRKESSAKIIERKMLANGKLMLSYVFDADGKIFAGSTITENKVIPADSVTVIFQGENPSLSHVNLP